MSMLLENDYLNSINYIPIKESEYTTNHPLVLEWTDVFHKEFLSQKIFEKFGAIQSSDTVKAELVGYSWHHFSARVAQFLCYASAKVSTNRLRHYVIQIAFEELGMRDVNEIHADMFQQAFIATQFNVQDKMGDFIPKSLSVLNCEMKNFTSDGYILGVLLGFEIPAVENISAVFNSLAFDAPRKSFLEKTKFFQLHQQIETEHIRLNVSNFLRFCDSESDRTQFKIGVTNGIKFWTEIWNEVGEELIRRNQLRKTYEKR